MNAEKPEDDALIPGIYNYCDRWCERCAQTARCIDFMTERERDPRHGRPPGRELDKREFRHEVSETVALTLHLIRREVEKLGIDLDDPGLMEAVAVDERQRRWRTVREDNPLSGMATAYAKTARKVLEGLDPELRAAESMLAAEAQFGTGDPLGVAADINDAIMVAKWYLYFIDMKLWRAVSSRANEAREGDNGFPSDADGSAKVALVAIDRSIAAWARLREHLNGVADAILDVLVQLEKLRRAVEREFPRARAFRRPGLD